METASFGTLADDVNRFVAIEWPVDLPAFMGIMMNPWLQADSKCPSLQKFLKGATQLGVDSLQKEVFFAWHGFVKSLILSFYTCYYLIFYLFIHFNIVTYYYYFI